MKIPDADPAFVGRLENWGAFYRDPYKPGRSAIADVCEQLAVEHGIPIRDGYAESNPRPEIDEDDARIIQWCWSNSQYRMDPKHWALLRAHYVMRHDKRVICRAMKLRQLSYDSEVKMASMRFQGIVMLLESCNTSYLPG